MPEIIVSHGWNNNLHLNNGSIELVISLDVGPRVIRLAHVGGPNVFKEYPDQLGKSGEAEWKIRGGHRFWISPESPENGYTYAPDNKPVPYEKIGPNHYKISSGANLESGWNKELEVRLDADNDRVTLTHRIVATRDLDFAIAPWALSVMAPGGLAVIPQPEKGTHPADLLPNRRLVLWPYTDVLDARYNWSWPNILVQQRSDAGPTKFGLLHRTGWVGYQLGDTLFAKTIPFSENSIEAGYPDMGVNFELFSNEEMLELESVAPLSFLKRNQTSEHTETWILKKSGDIDWKSTSLLDLVQ